jgi:DNA-binding CsgD family transcriptional regulator
MERKNKHRQKVMSERLMWRFAAIGLFVFQTACLTAFFWFRVEPEWVLHALTGVYVISTIGLCYLVFFDPMNFWIYAVLFLMYAAAGMLMGEILLPLFLFALSWGFLYKKRFFTSRKRVKVFFLIGLFVVCLCSQYRFGGIHLICSIINFLAVTSLVLLIFFVQQPIIRKFVSRRDEAILRLSKAQFSERDVCILQQVLGGEKYEAIAASHGIAVSTLKNILTGLYKKTGVNDRTGFLLTYANYEIMAEDSEGML